MMKIPKLNLLLLLLFTALFSLPAVYGSNIGSCCCSKYKQKENIKLKPAKILPLFCPYHFEELSKFRFKNLKINVKRMVYDYLDQKNLFKFWILSKDFRDSLIKEYLRAIPENERTLPHLVFMSQMKLDIGRQFEVPLRYMNLNVQIPIEIKFNVFEHEVKNGPGSWGCGPHIFRHNGWSPPGPQHFWVENNKIDYGVLRYYGYWYQEFAEAGIEDGIWNFSKYKGSDTKNTCAESTGSGLKIKDKELTFFGHYERIFQSVQIRVLTHFAPGSIVRAIGDFKTANVSENNYQIKKGQVLKIMEIDAGCAADRGSIRGSMERLMGGDHRHFLVDKIMDPNVNGEKWENASWIYTNDFEYNVELMTTADLAQDPNYVPKKKC